MATFRLRYVKAYKDRHGKARHYYRRPGLPTVQLPGGPGSKEFMDAYHAAGAGAPRKIGQQRVAPGSFSAVIADYYESGAYVALKDITKRTYRNVLERFRADFGDIMVRDFTPKRLDEFLDALADRPGSRDTFRKVLRLILNLAVRRELIKQSPMAGLRLPRKAQRGYRPWTEDNIAAFEAKWKTGTRERLAMALLLYTGQRRSDVAPMGPQHVKGSKIRVKQQKGGAELWIALHSRLKAEIAAAPKAHLAFIVTQYGKPFTAAGFGNWFGEKAQAAGLPEGCTAHGLRKAAARRLAEAGCTPHQIMAVTGHANLSEVTLYTAAADQERLADEAIARTELSTR